MIWIWAAAAAALVLGLGQLRLGLLASYDGQARAQALLGPVKISLYPRPARTAPPRQGGPSPGGKKRPSITAGQGLALARGLLPIALEAAGRTRRKIRVDRLRMTLVVGGGDPAEAALWYGRGCAVMGTLWGPLTEAFQVVDGQGSVQVDFDRRDMELTGEIKATLTLVQALGLGLVFGPKAIRVFQDTLMRQKGGISHGKTTSLK